MRTFSSSFRSQARHVWSSVSTHLAKGFTSEIEVPETKQNCARALPDYLCRIVDASHVITLTLSGRYLFL